MQKNHWLSLLAVVSVLFACVIISTQTNVLASSKADGTTGEASVQPVIPKMTPAEIEQEATQKPPASEVEPSGPEISPTDAREAAEKDVRIVASEPDPQQITMARGTVGNAQTVMEAVAHASNPQFVGSGTIPWSKFAAYLVVLHGNFRLTMHVPRGHESPQGSVMALIIDAHTGIVEGRYIGNETPNLNSLGPTISG